MSNGESLKLPLGLLGALKRPQYDVGNYLAANDLLTEQRYRLQRLRRHNRYLHGWGVLCGLHVVPARDSTRAWALWVCPGYAISCCGDEIEVPTPAMVDVRDYLWRRPLQGGRPARLAYIGIRYVEQDARPVPANPPACGCDDTIYKSSRIQDGFQVDAIWALPEAPTAEEFDLCEQGLAPCPECPDSPYVVLARLSLPASEGDPITIGHIDNLVRRQPYNTVALQEQLIACCCQEEQQPTLAADLQIKKEEKEREETPQGLKVTYSIEVTNDGPATAQEVIVTDTLTVNVGNLLAISDFMTSQGTWIQKEIPGPFVAQLGTVEPNQKVTLEFAVAIRFVQSIDVINMATVSGSTPDLNPSNNSDSTHTIIPG